MALGACAGGVSQARGRRPSTWSSSRRGAIRSPRSPPVASRSRRPVPPPRRRGRRRADLPHRPGGVGRALPRQRSRTAARLAHRRSARGPAAQVGRPDDRHHRLPVRVPGGAGRADARPRPAPRGPGRPGTRSGARLRARAHRPRGPRALRGPADIPRRDERAARIRHGRRDDRVLDPAAGHPGACRLVRRRTVRPERGPRGRRPRGPRSRRPRPSASPPSRPGTSGRGWPPAHRPAVRW